MIIPIGHDQAIRRYPWVTISLITLCTLVQIWSTVSKPSERELQDAQHDIMQSDTEEEAEAKANAILDKIPEWRFGYHTGSGITFGLITSAFVHGGWMHLIGNMLFLWLVGSALEDKWGRAQFLGFYLAGAVASTYCYSLLHHGEEANLIGASGAISAAMGAFLVNFARTEITIWYFLMYRTGTFRIAAYIALPLWLAEQFLWMNLDKGGTGGTSVAYEAHIGGFVFGLTSALVIRSIWKDPAPGYDQADEEDGRPEAMPEARALRAPAAAAGGNDRERQCLDAIKRKDMAGIRTTSSRVIIDLARIKNYKRVLEIYDTITAAGLRTIPLTDGAFVATAESADALGDHEAYVKIVDALRAEHPGSVQVPKVLWRMAELYGRSGQQADELATLELLAERYPRHEHGAKAAKELAKRKI